MCGTLDYLSPELVGGHSYDYHVDIWAVGILLFEFLTGNPPFETAGQDETKQKILRNNITFPTWMNPDAIDLITSLLQTDPTARMALSQVRHHPFIEQHLGKASELQQIEDARMNALEIEKTKYHQEKLNEYLIHQRQLHAPQVPTVSMNDFLSSENDYQTTPIKNTSVFGI